MIRIDARGDACPLPIVKTKQALATLSDGGEIEVWVDNDMAVENLRRLADHDGHTLALSQQDDVRIVKLTVAPTNGSDAQASTKPCTIATTANHAPRVVVTITRDTMGHGDDTLGRLLLKGFLFALTQQPTVPDQMLFYNSGVFVTTSDGPELDDLRTLAARGTEILSCGTCLSHHKRLDALKVGAVTNMYDIAASLLSADRIITP